MDTPDIFDYLDHRAFLRDWFQAKKAVNPRYSHRVFVRKTGQKSPSLLADVIGGRRNLTQTTARSFCRAMVIKGPEARFFQLLAAFDRAETTTEKNKIWNKIASTRRFREGRQLEEAGVEYLSHWYYPVIKEMGNLPGFEAEPSWIAHTLRPSISTAEARTALDQLFTMGILERDAEGVVGPRDADIVTPPEVQTLAIKNYYREMLGRAINALDEFRAAERHFTTVTVAIPQDMVPRLKEELTQMATRLNTLCEEARGENDQVIQINLNFHPMTASGEGE